MPNWPGWWEWCGVKVEKDERLTSTSLAPTLLKPAVTPRQLLTSHTLRHTFRNPHIAALGKTALDLIESEGAVGRAVGRCWAAMERGGWNEDPEPKGDEAEDDEPVNGMDVDEPSDSSTAIFARPSTIRRSRTSTSCSSPRTVSPSHASTTLDNPSLCRPLPPRRQHEPRQVSPKKR